MRICRLTIGWLLISLLATGIVGSTRWGFAADRLFVRPVSAHALLPAYQTQTPQGNAGAFLGLPEIQDFPRVRMQLAVYDAQGGFVHDLTPEQVTILEDGKQLPAAGLQAIRPGVQVVVAINPGPSFAIRNTQAVSRYDLVKDALRSWANSRMGSNVDDLSLLITGGPAVSHTADPAQWITSLNSEQVDARGAAPSLDTLFRAVSLASDPIARPGMSRAVLFISSPPEGQLDQSLENLAAQAREQHIVIYLWLVASSGALSTQSAQQLIALSQGTGGKVYTFSGEEPLPSPETYLAPLRDIYQLDYESKATTSGAHEVAVQVRAGEASIQSQPRSFQIELLPVQPTFVEPPLRIVVDAPEADALKAGASAAAAAYPAQTVDPPAGEQVVEVVFDFPDGRKRALAYSALLVDGEVTAENLEAPFDRFTWKVGPYTGNGVARLQVQVRDTLGLTGMSAEQPVEIVLEQPERSAQTPFQRSLPILSGLAALVAGAVLVLVLVVGGQLRPRTLRAARRRRKADPVTQPVHIHTEAPAYHRGSWANRLQWPGRNNAPKADAYLNPLPDPDNEDTLLPIPIAVDDLTLGSDPTLSSLLLDDPSVEGLHARLVHQEDGSYLLADEGSIAGTWINYTPVSSEGARLEHGDLIHIGRIGMRFTLRKPAPQRKAVVVPDDQPAQDEPVEEDSV